MTVCGKAPTGVFFLAPAGCCSLRLQRKAPLDPKVILAAGRTDGQEVQYHMGRFPQDTNFARLVSLKFFFAGPM